MHAVSLLLLDGCPLRVELYIHSGRLDRVGLPEDQYKEPKVQGNDARSFGLSHVASLWKGKQSFSSILHISAIKLMDQFVTYSITAIPNNITVYIYYYVSTSNFFSPKVTEERNHDLVYVYRQYFESNVNPQNLGLFIDSYIRRTDLAIERNLDPIRRKDARTLKMPVLNVTGAHSPHVDDTVTFNGRLDPVDSTWMKVC